ncbi:hypothetical protein NP493_8194g00002 [Ridgeia piscesae]|uniref:Uncharacterized protein n=1 Tax=Ridgeia piscesae TaxID=27915 RepID=A0AAD9MPK3_RIDPI|nr:hypothetical protein NP493_8194g00002 [Ridgeia piscesae]
MRGELTDNSKFKLDGRHTIARRKMSKNDRLLDTTETVHSSFIDGIQDLKHVETNDVLHHVGKSDGDIENRKIQTSEAKFPKDESQDATHWKELLLLHLDLIQQKREMCCAAKLRHSPEKAVTLKCRLERMDRRMALLRQQKFHSNGFPMTPQQTQCDVSTGSPAASPSLLPVKSKTSLVDTRERSLG